MHSRIAGVTDRIARRSADSRRAYLDRIHGAAARGPKRTVHSSDTVRLDARIGRLEIKVADADWAWRTAAEPDLAPCACGLDREMFANFRASVSNADAGAVAIAFLPEPQPHTRAAADAAF
jgi:phosphogluconate dehydratase